MRAPFLKLVIKGLIGRDLFTPSTYSRIVNPINPIYKEALQDHQLSPRIQLTPFQSEMTRIFHIVILILVAVAGAAVSYAADKNAGSQI